MSALLRQAALRGGRDALAAFGVSQPSPQSVGIKTPSVTTLSAGLPKAPKTPSLKAEDAVPRPADDKRASAVGMGASRASAQTGAVRGAPADAGRRQRSTVERAFRANEEGFATSSMPEPGDVSP